MDDLNKISRAKRGDNEALAELLQDHYLFVLRYMIQITLHRQTAEDLTQDTMIRAIEKINLYDEHQSKFTSWLITIATRLYLDQKRRHNREQTLLTAGEMTRNLRWQIENSSESWSALVDALGRLPQHTRAAVVLKHYYGYGYEEIGNMLNLPTGTVKSRVHHGLTELRKEWLADDEQDISNEQRKRT